MTADSRDARLLALSPVDPSRNRRTGASDVAFLEVRSFYDPRVGANMISVGTEYDARPAYVVSPSAGTLLMWPSPVEHSVHPNLSKEQRISISFNLQMHPRD